MPRRYTLPAALLPAFMVLPLLAAAPVHAYPNSTAQLALHLSPPVLNHQCPTSPPPCAGIVTNGDLAPHTYFAYLLLTHGDPVAGIAGLACGIQYNGAPRQGVDVFSWNLCATLEFSSTGWPNAGGGDLITWDSSNRCQRNEPGGPGTGVSAVAGYFYLGAYTPDRMDIVPRPVDGAARLADCSSNEAILESSGLHRTPYPLGSAMFSSGAGVGGYNPCAGVTSGCLISGPLTVSSGQADVPYSVLGALAGDTFSWTITGSGSIVGATDAQTVRITAGDVGSFTLGVELSRSSGVTRCESTVTVTGQVCLIQGPDFLIEGTANNVFSVFDILPADGIHWSVSGPATITSPLDGSSVTVAADSPGFCRLSVSSADGQIACAKDFRVQGAPCTIDGPTNVPSHTTNIEYTAAVQVPGTTYAWSVTGSGTLVGPANGPTVRVSSGSPGPLVLTLLVSRSGASRSCPLEITVFNAGNCANTQENARILVHLRPTTTRNACGNWGSPACSDVVTNGALYPTTYYGYLLVCQADAFAGLAGVECGVHYADATQTGVDVYAWTLCGSTEFHTADWPASGSGNRITWEATAKCQRTEPGGPGTGVTANAGYFYLASYTPDRLQVTPHPLTGVAKVADCSACESVLAHTVDGLYPNLGNANFTAGGTAAGYNPCGSVVPVLKTTWSSIKAYFKGTDTPRK